jgi:hypothetical protein
VALLVPVIEDESKATRFPSAESAGFRPEPEVLPWLPPLPPQLGTIAAATRIRIQVAHPRLRWS